MRQALHKGIPPLFVNMRSLYTDPEKVSHSFIMWIIWILWYIFDADFEVLLLILCLIYIYITFQVKILEDISLSYAENLKEHEKFAKDGKSPTYICMFFV